LPSASPRPYHPPSRRSKAFAPAFSHRYPAPTLVSALTFFLKKEPVCLDPVSSPPPFRLIGFLDAENVPNPFPSHLISEVMQLSSSPLSFFIWQVSCLEGRAEVPPFTRDFSLSHHPLFSCPLEASLPRTPASLSLLPSISIVFFFPSYCYEENLPPKLEVFGSPQGQSDGSKARSPAPFYLTSGDNPPLFRFSAPCFLSGLLALPPSRL